MSGSGFVPTQDSGTLHQFAPRLLAFEHARPSGTTSSPIENALIFTGGLGDGLLTVPYTPALSARLPPSWTFAQLLLSSSYSGWGTESVAQDANEISKAVAYFRDERGLKGRIVIMGHSTGSQDVMEYFTGANSDQRTPVDGVIMQAPASDREVMGMLMQPETYKSGVETARQYVNEGRGEEILPMKATANFFGAPCCAKRWLSLASPDHDGEEDFFSSDLSDEQLNRTFGLLAKKQTPTCILHSQLDEFVPPHVDKAALLERWIRTMRANGGRVDEKHSGIIKDGTHTFKDASAEVRADLEARVIGFLNDLTT